jgi:tRNA(adenine34) deaminase
VDYKSLMQQAILLAKEAAVKGDVPVGAIVVDESGNVVGQGANLREQNNDPTAHAEIVAIRHAAKNIGNYRLDNLTMVVTLEPCVMCTGAIVQAKFKRLVFSTYNIKQGAVGSIHDLIRDSRNVKSIEVISGVLENESTELVKHFFASQRSQEG